MDFKVKWSSMG